MASELKVNTLTGVSTAGSIAVTGEGNSTTTNLQQGLAKAWCDYDSSGTTFNDSFNMTSATDNGTGDYTFTIANDLGGTRHSAVVSCTNDTVQNTTCVLRSKDATSTRLTIRVGDSGSNADKQSHMTTHGDLA